MKAMCASVLGVLLGYVMPHFALPQFNPAGAVQFPFTIDGIVTDFDAANRRLVVQPHRFFDRPIAIILDPDVRTYRNTYIEHGGIITSHSLEKTPLVPSPGDYITALRPYFNEYAMRTKAIVITSDRTL